MNDRTKFKMRQALLLALKIAVGSSLAIYIAQLLNLQNAMSAGIITLLTLVTTKWETLKLSVMRLGTYFFTIVVCHLTFMMVHSVWIEFGILLFIIVLVGERMGWRSTLSVNAVIGTHFFISQDFTVDFILNELLLIVIGIVIAIILNLIHINDAHEQGIIKSMRHVEHQMKQILIELAGYLEGKATGNSVWEDISKLEKELEEFVELAYEFQNNTFVSHPAYYIEYFEMRLMQCGALHNLHAEMKRMREMPKQAHIVSDFIYEISQHVTEMNDPQALMDKIEYLVEKIHEGDLPKTKEEFMSQAELYHTLMDLEEFLMYKKRFIEEIDDIQFKVYWKSEIEGK